MRDVEVRKRRRIEALSGLRTLEYMKEKSNDEM